MDNNKPNLEKYIIPICQKKGCDGILKIELNEKESNINYICEKNNNHRGELYFKTFERFILKKNIIKNVVNVILF